MSVLFDNFSYRLRITEDGIFRKELPRYVDCISTYSDDKEIKRIYCENEFPPMYESMIRYLKNIKLI